MATISKGTVQDLLEKLGPKPNRKAHFAEVWEYWHTGIQAVRWAVFTKAHFNDLADSPFVGSRLLLWSKGLGQRAHIGDLQGAMDEEASVR